MRTRGAIARALAQVRRGGFRIREEAARGVVGGEQILHRATEPGVRAAPLVEQRPTPVRRQVTRVAEDLLRGRHGSNLAPSPGLTNLARYSSARYSHARANCRSRLTVRSDNPSTRAVSSTLSPVQQRRHRKRV